MGMLGKCKLFCLLVTLALALCAPCFAGSETGFTGTIVAGGIDFTATLVVNNAGFVLPQLEMEKAFVR